MNIFLINKFFLIVLSFLIICGCNTKNVYNKLKPKTYKVLTSENIDQNNILLNSFSTKKINLDKKIILKKISKNNKNESNIVLGNSQIFAIQNNSELLEFNFETGKLISSKKIPIQIYNEDYITSFKYIDNFFIIAFKSGLIIKININGDIIWKFNSNKILNTELNFFEDQLIFLFGDEIKSINIIDGSERWSEIYEDLPIYQSNGGQLVNFLNIIYYILPNNKVGSFDYNLGMIHNSKFDEIPLISSINNINDKIHINENQLYYLDEGNYLYSFDILDNEFILFKHSIKLTSSNIFFNNSLILKEGNALQAININNGKTFWIIENKKINKKSKIIAIRNLQDNIEIYLDNGEILIINNKELVNINDLGVKNINNITFETQRVIVSTNTGKYIIF